MLEQGVSVADIGCGNGRALIKLAQAFPNSRFTGYDIFEPAIKQARKNAVEAGVSDRVTFQTIVPNQSMPVKFDVITTFDVLHDSADPDQLVRTIYYALKPEGIYVCLEINSADTVEEMAGPLGALLYGYSVLYCMTTSLAAGGAGLGTVGLPESKLRRLIMAHNFSDFRRVVDDDPFSVVYEINK
jgi:2-polyprenyl-3-methyl-5-hydroxy-6-metoxy-1,4-benzoquinol methylase